MTKLKKLLTITRFKKIIKTHLKPLNIKILLKIKLSNYQNLLIGKGIQTGN